MIKAKLVHIKTEDGLKLPGLFYPAFKSKKALIYLHGNGGSSVFYDEDKRIGVIANEIVKKGISFLPFNNRGANVVKNFYVGTGKKEKRIRGGMAFEKIKDCVKDIEGTVKFLKERGHKEIYLAGLSTGANKICVYDHYRPKNEIKKYLPLAGGDDTGIYYNDLKKEKFWELLARAKKKLKQKKGEELMPEVLSRYIFSYRGFYDIANPDGDYNTFPFLEKIRKIKLSRKPLFRYFKNLKKPSLVIYGENDEYAWGSVPRIVEILKKYRPDFDYVIIKNADHGFDGHEKELGKLMGEWINK